MDKPVYTVRCVTGAAPDFEPADRAEIACYPWAGDGGYCPSACGQLLHDGTALYARLVCHEAAPRVTCREANDPVYEDSCLELFLNPRPGVNTFADFEFNAAGVLLLGHYREGDFGLLDPAARGDFDVRARIDRERGLWEVRFAIPFAFLCRLFGLERVPDELEGNFYKCGDRTARPHFGCWSPVVAEKPDFFRADCFGRIVLET